MKTYEEMNKDDLLLEIARLEAKIARYQAQYGELEEPNASLYLDIPMDDKEKLSVFMDYFAAREDIVAERYEKDGKKHYNKGCLNRFKSHLGCDYQKTHCKNCPAFKPRPYDEKAVSDHMRKKSKMIGIYPILPGNKVKLLVFDLDHASYLKDTSKMISTLSALGLHYVLERSQSGQGMHVWLFFEEATKASDVRKIGNYILTETMDRFGGLGLESYDRFFPYQDKVDDGGYGNLIALPLNIEFAKEGKTVFLDDEFNVIDKPIHYLTSVLKISVHKTKELLELARKKDEYGVFGEKALNLSLSKDDFNGKLHLLYAGDIYIPIHELTPRSERIFMRLASSYNQDYFKLLHSRKSIRFIPKFNTYFKKDEAYLRLPRLYKESIITLLKRIGVDYSCDNALTDGKPIEVKMKITLRPDQLLLAERALSMDEATISAPTGFGKTVLGAYLLAKRSVNTLIIVPSVNLLTHWKAKLRDYLEIEDKDIGTYSSKGNRCTGIIDIVSIQSLVRNEALRNQCKEYGLVIVDEAHHMGAYKYEEALRNLAPQYLYGLTATPKRSDAREDIVYRCIGPLIESADAVVDPNICRCYHPRFTRFTSVMENGDIGALLKEVCFDQERNEMILEDCLNAYQSGKKILLLTERIDHAKYLYASLEDKVKNLSLIYGALPDKEKLEEKKRIQDFGNEPFVVISIGRFIGEGYDDPRFDTLFITYPFRWKGILAQYCGRLHRRSTLIKRVDVYDYVDPLVSVLARMYSSREKGYYELGYQLENMDPKYHNEILSMENYEQRLEEDLSKANQGVMMSISYCHESKVKHYLSLIHCPHSILTNKQIDVEGDVLRVDGPVIDALIIDLLVVYYGGINPFIYGQKEGTIMRFEDKDLAKQMRDLLLKVK